MNAVSLTFPVKIMYIIIWGNYKVRFPVLNFLVSYDSEFISITTEIFLLHYKGGRWRARATFVYVVRGRFLLRCDSNPPLGVWSRI